LAERERLICASDELVDGGAGVRFELAGEDEAATPAFVVRHQGHVRGYLNRCGHIPVELDWQHGQFFDGGGLYLICATHGALYDPATGRCVGGRCNGRGLVPLQVTEHGGSVYVLEG
jgi:nitrite reductase/ring-hydroxylating ferredoxin subunit